MGNDIRERVVAGQASREEAQAFVEALKDRLVKALDAAADANNRLAQEKDAARHLIDAFTEVVKAEPQGERARLAVAAIDRHEAESPVGPVER